MNMKFCKAMRILALALILAILLPCMPALAASYSAAVTGKQGLLVFTDAGMKNAAGTLPRYTVFTVKAVNEKDVAKIEYEGKIFYCEVDNGMTAVKDFATPATVNQKTRVYEEADEESRGTDVKKGTGVYILATNNDWAMVEKDGNVAYIPEQYLDIDADDPFAGGGVDPNDNNSALTGSSSVVIETVEAVVSDAKLTVYKSASTSSKKLGTLKQGEEVTVYAYNESWAYIRLDGEYGFCALDGLKKADASNDNPFDSEKSVPATVTASSVVVYESASSSSKKLGTLKKGAEVKLLKKASGWAYIELNGKYGYCDSDAVTESEAILPDADKGDVIDGKSPYGTCTVITAQADYYSSKSTSKKIGSLTMGDTVSFYGYDSKWILVGVNGSFAYMQRKTLSADSYTELKNEDSGTAVLDMEKALLALGYLDSIPSANFSAETVNALKRLQASCGMENTGVADEATLRVLYSGNAPASPLLSGSFTKGDNNSSVKRIQARLHALGYLASAASVDGDYGSNTAAAVRLFQKVAGGTQTGTADSKTIRALYNAAAPELPSDEKAADASGSSGNSSSIDSSLSSNVSEYVSGMSNAQKLEYVIYIAQQQLGKPYVFGSAGTSSFDCSGLTMYCFKQIGIKLSHSAYGEGYNEKWRKISSISAMKRGDLVFLNTISDGDLSDHTGIYLGSGKFIHASSGSAKVIVSDLTSGYYNRVFSWGRRVLET